MVSKHVEEYNKWKLELNMEKAQHRIIGRTDLNIELENGISQYDFLGVLISEDRKDGKDIMSNEVCCKSKENDINVTSR